MHKYLFKEKVFETTWNKDYIVEGGFFLSERDYNQTLITKINQCSAIILKKNIFGGGANSILCPWELLDLFMDLEYYVSYDLYSIQSKINKEIFCGGVLSGRYKVWFTNRFLGEKRFTIIEKKGFFDFGKNEIILYKSKSKQYASIKVI
jgi:hypothetical protein